MAFARGRTSTTAPSRRARRSISARPSSASWNPLIRTLAEPATAGDRRVNGVAAGAGANIALACDLVVAAKSAKFIQSFSAIGLIPDSGGTWALPRLVGQARALGLALTGEPLPAEKAAEWGLIWKAVDDEALDAEVDALAAKLAALPPLGLAAIKQMIRDAGPHARPGTRSSSATPCAAWVSPRIIAKALLPSSKSAKRNSLADDRLIAS